MPTIEFQDVSVTRNGKRIVDGFSLRIEHGEYISIVGETGAGKTTILNLINGLVAPDAGRILIDGKDASSIPCEHRDAGMVFENYALFPHYNVYKNIAYSHRVRDKDVEGTRKAAREVLTFMLLSGRDGALPAELSGGMQQRVALGRALMTNSGILLLDDPFSALDAGLRMNLRIEIRNLAKDIGTTVIHCTNDVEEAMMVADRMVLMRDGRIEQAGQPDHVYYHPANLYVASFFGDVNVMECIVASDRDEMGHVFLTDPATPREREFHVDTPASTTLHAGSEVLLCLRSEHMQMRAGSRKKPNRTRGTIQDISFLGHIIRYEVSSDAGFVYKVQRFVNEKTRHMHFKVGEEVTLYFNSRLGLLFPAPAPRGNDINVNDDGRT